MPSTAPSRPSSAADAEECVEDGDRALGALEPETLRADVLRGQELLEGLRSVEAAEQEAHVLVRELDLDALDPLLDPALLLGVLDVHVLDADGPAVGVAQHVEQVAELHALPPGHAARRELPVEVPDGEPVGGGVELVVHLRLFPGQRVEVGDEVAAHPVDPHERGDLHLLAEELLLPVDRADVAAPVDLLVGHTERPEHVVVEAVLADEALVHGLEEHARLGALDDAVVVGGGDRDDLADAELARARSSAPCHSAG